MPNEQLAATVSVVSEVFNAIYRRDGNNHFWCLSFGALRYFCTDRLLGKPFNEDIDISVYQGEVSEDMLNQNMEQYGYMPTKRFVNDQTGDPFQIVYSPVAGGMASKHEIDVFFWVRANGYFWHTYDYMMEGRTKPSKYYFKGTREDLFLAGTMDLIWEEIAPAIKIPKMCGSLLDVWYPPKIGPDGKPMPNSCWFIADPKYGQSKWDKFCELPNCYKLGVNLK